MNVNDRHDNEIVTAATGVNWNKPEISERDRGRPKSKFCRKLCKVSIFLAGFISVPSIFFIVFTQLSKTAEGQDLFFGEFSFK